MNDGSRQLVSHGGFRAFTWVSRRLKDAGSVQETLDIAVQAVVSMGLGTGAMGCAEEGELVRASCCGELPDDFDKVPESADTTALVAVGSMSTNVRSVALTVEDVHHGWLFVVGSSPNEESEGRWLLIGLADQVAVTLEQIRLDRETEELEEQVVDGLTAMAALGHDIRSPLQVIRTSLHLLERTETKEAVRTEASAQAKRALSHITSLFEDVQATAALVRGRVDLDVSRASLSELWSQAVAVFGALPAQGEVSIDAGLEVLADRMRVRQILVNLLDNAKKYAPEAPLQVWTESEPGWVSLHVRDGGPGVPIEEAERIFDLFRRGRSTQVEEAQPKGFGLGLGMSRKLAQAMGGNLLLDVSSPSGAHFILRLREVDGPSGSFDTGPDDAQAAR